jgi:hypothetical protein
MRMATLLYRDPLQCPFVCVSQRGRQFIQGFANARRHTSTERVQLAKHPSKPVQDNQQEKSCTVADDSHALGTFRKRIYNEFSVLFFPSLHCSVRLNERAKVPIDILSLTGFIMKRDPAG